MLIPLLMKERSIDDFIDSDGECRLSTLLEDRSTVSQEEHVYVQQIRRLVRQALITLDERERHIIRNRFGLLGGKELTLEEIGRTLNLSRERVRQLEREAKHKIRLQLARFQPQPGFSPS